MDKKILVVDDEKEYLKIAMGYILEDSIPLALLGASNGKTAYQIACSELPDIIITDWEMPEMDGIELIIKLKNNPKTKDIPVIMSTGIRLLGNDLNRAFNAGASDFIRKPLEKNEFISRINSHLHMANFIKTIKEQKTLLDDAEEKRLRSTIEILNEQLDTNNTQLQFFNRLLADIIRQLHKLDIETPAIKEKILSICSQITHSKQKVNGIDTEQSFPSNGFVKKLLKKHTTLTPQETRLSFMLRNNLSSKEIASLTFCEETSVKVARSRLRKKLGLKESCNLNSYMLLF